MRSLCVFFLSPALIGFWVGFGHAESVEVVPVYFRIGASEEASLIVSLTPQELRVAESIEGLANAKPAKCGSKAPGRGSFSCSDADLSGLNVPSGPTYKGTFLGFSGKGRVSYASLSLSMFLKDAEGTDWEYKSQFEIQFSGNPEEAPFNRIPAIKDVALTIEPRVRSADRMGFGIFLRMNGVRVYDIVVEEESVLANAEVKYASGLTINRESRVLFGLGYRCGGRACYFANMAEDGEYTCYAEIDTGPAAGLLKSKKQIEWVKNKEQAKE